LVRQITVRVGSSCALALLVVLGGCARHGKVEAPPHAHDKIVAPRQTSIIAVPLDADISVLDTALERAIPRRLWAIDQHFDKCVEPQKVKIFAAKLAITPKLGCTVTGQVTRGALRLRGQGEDILVDLPIQAAIAARNVGGVLSKTATGTAMAHARIRIDLSNNWTPRATIKLAYDWKQPPGIDLLGNRVTFTDKVDEKLAPIVRGLERDLPNELSKIALRSKVEAAWRQSFTALMLNDSNPQVWMRVTPQRIDYGGYVIKGRTLQLKLGMEALTETFIGPRPADPAPTPLPPASPLREAGTLRMFVPVIADYAQLEPVILKALTKRAARPIEVPGLGPVDARFERITAYGTDGGRIAVGITLAARQRSGTIGETRGLVWLTALPVNTPGTQVVRFENLAVTGATDSISGDLLLRLVNAPGVGDTVAQSLTQNFAGDVNDLLRKIRLAIVDNRQGDFLIHARVDSMTNGTLKAAGEGLYLPVWATGEARVEYRPARGAALLH
jgi:hypothetical protein